MSLLQRQAIRKLLISALALVLLVGFCWLGSWQLQRREWKLDLINRIETQLAKAPVSAPGPSAWDNIDSDDAYLPVSITGSWLHDRETLVQAMTVLGSGYWVITPLKTLDGSIVLVNRGFVDQPHRSPQSRPASQQTGQLKVTGLLRLSEPGGRFPRTNNSTEDRWYSRDVAAIAYERRISADVLAPYFIDADAASNASDWPVGGLTVVDFRNTHLAYAITWYALALLTLAGTWIVLRKK